MKKEEPRKARITGYITEKNFWLLKKKLADDRTNLSEWINKKVEEKVSRKPF
jgi:hypothetical protein